MFRSCLLVVLDRSTDAKVDESFINSAALAGVKAPVGASERCTWKNDHEELIRV